MTPSYVLTLFIVSVLALAWAIATLIRRKSRNDSAIFCSFVDLCFVGAFIAGVYELRNITHANCSHFGLDSDFYVSLGPNGFDSNGSPFTGSINKTCAMLKASFAFGIMNTIFFFFTSFLLLFMHRRRRGDRKVVEKRDTVYSSRRRSHDSRYVDCSAHKNRVDDADMNTIDVATHEVAQAITGVHMIAGVMTAHMCEVQRRSLSRSILGQTRRQNDDGRKEGVRQVKYWNRKFTILAILAKDMAGALDLCRYSFDVMKALGRVDSGRHSIIESWKWPN